MVDMLKDDFSFCKEAGWYYLNRDYFIVFLNSPSEWIAGFFSGFSLVTDFLSPIYSIILTPADMPFEFSIF